MSQTDSKDNIRILGINGLGRIGKLTLWHHIARKYFNCIVVNIGRQVGTGFDDLIHYVERDSTYGSLHGFLYGYSAEPVIRNKDKSAGMVEIDGVKVIFLQKERNPAGIDWQSHQVRLVVEV